MIYHLVEIATDAERIQSENWGLNMEICDYINFTSDGGRNALRAIRKRLQTQMGKNNATVMYTLTVLETCVKNCDQRFIVLVCQKEFINELVRLISAKYDAPQAVQERVLELIQAWSDAFKSNPALVGVTEVYEELKSKGVEFPATDFDKMAPINTPKRVRLLLFIFFYLFGLHGFILWIWLLSFWCLFTFRLSIQNPLILNKLHSNLNNCLFSKSTKPTQFQFQARLALLSLHIKSYVVIFVCAILFAYFIIHYYICTTGFSSGFFRQRLHQRPLLFNNIKIPLPN